MSVLVHGLYTHGKTRGPCTRRGRRSYSGADTGTHPIQELVPRDRSYSIRERRDKVPVNNGPLLVTVYPCAHHYPRTPKGHCSEIRGARGVTISSVCVLDRV